MPEIKCPTCLQPVKFKDEAVGTQVRCFSCGCRFLVDKGEDGELRTRDAPPLGPATGWPQDIRGETGTSAKSPIAAKITAVAASIIAICVLALTVARFRQSSQKSESLDEKMAHYRKLCQECERMMGVKFRVDLQRAEAKPKTFAEEKETYERLYREAGVDPRDLDRILSEKHALAQELGIRETD